MKDFELDITKTSQAIIWLKFLGVTHINEICKLLYLADQYHLVKYGRMITGDTYIKRELYGPVPKFASVVDVRGVKLDIECLSESDIMCLQHSDLSYHGKILPTQSLYDALPFDSLIHSTMIAYDGGAEISMLEYIKNNIENENFFANFK